MVTGDRRDVAETIGALLGVDEVLAEQKPEDKLAAITASRSTGSTIMVGDGVNDAPALAAADVGVAMGARGTAASSEAAGVVLLVDRLDRLAEALHISRRRAASPLRASSQAWAYRSSRWASRHSVIWLPWRELSTGGYRRRRHPQRLRALRIHGLRDGREPVTQAQLGALKKEHDELSPVLERVRSTADRLAIVPAQAVARELSELNDLLREQLLPHDARMTPKPIPPWRASSEATTRWPL